MSTLFQCFKITSGSLLSSIKFKCLSIVYRTLYFVFPPLVCSHLIWERRKQWRHRPSGSHGLPSSGSCKPCARHCYDNFIYPISIMYHKIQRDHVKYSWAHSEWVVKLRFKVVQSGFVILPPAPYCHANIRQSLLICLIKHVLFLIKVAQIDFCYCQ